MTHPTSSLRRRMAGWAAGSLAGLLGASGSQRAHAGSDWFPALDANSKMPALVGATAWLNSPPLAAADLLGRVVLVEFWTYSCINCLRTLPYLRAWAQKYEAHGLVVMGAHTPEFDFEHDVVNVSRAVKDLGIAYPVAVDSRQLLWRAFGTRAWPTLYFVDARGRVRHRQLGEGRYEEAERMVQQLLREAGRRNVPTDLVAPQGQGTQAPPGLRSPASSETYLGAARADRFVSADGGLRPRRSHAYRPRNELALHQWTLAGPWRAEDEHVELAQAGGRIALRFFARDLHLVLAPSSDGMPIRFRVRLDGGPPGANHGSDVDPEGVGRIAARRLYQLVRQSDAAGQRLFEIEFLDSGVRAYAFTFG